MTRQSWRVLIAHGDTELLQEQSMIIQDLEPGIDVATQNSGLATLFDIVLRGPWDMVLCDQSIPGMSGAQVFAWAKNIRGDMPNFVLTTADPEGLQREQPGVCSEVLRVIRPDEIVEVLEKTILDS